MKQKCFYIDSSLGLYGWVLAESMKITTENINYDFILNKHIDRAIIFYVDKRHQLCYNKY